MNPLNGSILTTPKPRNTGRQGARNRMVLSGTTVMTVLLLRLRGETLKDIAPQHFGMSAQGLMTRFDKEGINLRVLTEGECQRRAMKKMSGHNFDDNLVCKNCGARHDNSVGGIPGMPPCEPPARVNL